MYVLASKPGLVVLCSTYACWGLKSVSVWLVAHERKRIGKIIAFRGPKDSVQTDWPGLLNDEICQTVLLGFKTRWEFLTRS